MVVDGAGWSWVEVDGAAWSWVHGLVIPKAKLFIHEDCKIGVKCFSTFAGKHLYRSVFFNKYSCRMQLKPIFIQKEVPALVFSWQLSEIFNNNFFKERKKALLWEKKHCYKKRGSDIYRKSNYATFFVTSPRFLYSSKALAQFIVTTGLSVSDGPISILSDIVISLRKSHEIIFVTYFWKTKNTCERCFWDVSEMSRKSHLFWDMPKTS